MDAGAAELRTRREAAGLSQQALAVKIGKHTASISQYERGVQHPRRDTAQALDDALDASGALLDAFGYSVNGSANGSSDYVTRSEFDQLKERIRGVAVVVDRMERALREAGVIGGTPPHGRDRPSA